MSELEQEMQFVALGDLGGGTRKKKGAPKKPPPRRPSSRARTPEEKRAAAEKREKRLMEGPDEDAEKAELEKKFAAFFHRDLSALGNQTSLLRASARDAVAALPRR